MATDYRGITYPEPVVRIKSVSESSENRNSNPDLSFENGQKIPGSVSETLLVRTACLHQGRGQMSKYPFAPPFLRRP